MLYKIVKSLLKPFLFLIYNIKVEGKENIPVKEGYIVCGNHIRAIDPILLAIAIPPQIHFMAKVELFKNFAFRKLLYAVGAYPIKRGEADIKSIKTSLRYLKEDKNIGIFPEGTRNKTDELRAEPGISMLSIRAQKDILPVSIKSDYKFFHRSKIIIGEIISLDEYYNKKLKNNDYTDISIEIMKKIRSL